MSSEICAKFFRFYMNNNEKDKAYSIYRGNPPQELIDEFSKEPEKKKKGGK